MERMEKFVEQCFGRIVAARWHPKEDSINACIFEELVLPERLLLDDADGDSS